MCLLLLSCALAMGMLLGSHLNALATEDELFDQAEDAAEAVEDAALTLDEAENQLAALTEECEALNAEIAAMQDEIDELAAAVLEAQSAKLAGREGLAAVVEYQYRNSSLIDVLTLLLSADSFGDFLKNLTYLESLVEHFTDEVAAQQERIDEFQALSAALTAQKDAQEEKMAELEAKIEEANALVEAAATALIDAEEEQDRIAELQAQAAALAASGELTEPVMVEEANTVDRQSVVSDDTPVIGDTTTVADDATETDEAETTDVSAEETSDAAATNVDDATASDADEELEATDSQADEAEAETETETEAETEAETSTEASASANESETDSAASSSSSTKVGYQTGIASAYGGETDPYTPNPGITATGAVCDDESMGVAVPMSWENYWEYYGRTVEITYNGITVYAVVNDCGYLGGGTRDLDLQPGVWKAFGFTSCTEWGLRLVTYRFL